ncbi:hypothetical protein SKAU_G00120520 [Synaphobranchus kaupii]|uniref:Uncharacterized protein n=1 Tax=Synaphobranchus kaupii TaxID=118154 RepID=A0A9Q1FNF1_SYNKA|nr:hypothetical protein SKAU_G00120520 [Synaphobranchus kaupii]
MKQQIQKPVTAAASRKVQAAVVRTPAGRAVGKPQSTATPVRGKAAPVEAAVRATTTRAGSRSQTASLVGARKPASDTTVNVSTTRATNKQPAAPPIGRGEPAQGKGSTRIQSRVLKSEKAAEVEEMDTSSADPHPEVEQARMEEREVVEGERKMEEGERKVEEERETPPAGFSFAPHGFVFQAPSSLQSFQSVPLTPRSAGRLPHSQLQRYSSGPVLLSWPPGATWSPIALSFSFSSGAR